MSVVTTVVRFAEGTASESSAPSPWLFGATALVALVALLVVTLMIKVGD